MAIKSTGEDTLLSQHREGWRLTVQASIDEVELVSIGGRRKMFASPSALFYRQPNQSTSLLIVSKHDS